MTETTKKIDQGAVVINDRAGKLIASLRAEGWETQSIAALGVTVLADTVSFSEDIKDAHMAASSMLVAGKSLSDMVTLNVDKRWPDRKRESPTDPKSIELLIQALANDIMVSIEAKLIPSAIRAAAYGECFARMVARASKGRDAAFIAIKETAMASFEKSAGRHFKNEKEAAENLAADRKLAETEVQGHG